MLFLVSGLFFANPSFAQNIPNCTSPSSDSDGDGYGWENNESCVVVSTTNVTSGGRCEDRGGYPWGWNPVTLEPCRLDSPSSNTTASSNSLIGINVVGNWYCRAQITTSDFFEPTFNRAPTINDTVSWVQPGSTSSAGGNGTCEQPSGAQWPAISKYEFSEDGNLTILNEVSVLTADCPEGRRTFHTFDNTVFGDWNYDGQLLTVNGEVIGEFGVEFKTSTVRLESDPSRSEEVSYQLLNLYMDNTHRLSCRNVGSDPTPRLLF